MNSEELAFVIDDIKRVTPMPGEFIVIRLKHRIDKSSTEALVRTLRSIFPHEQRILIVDMGADLSTMFGTCLHCGHDINPNGL